MILAAIVFKWLLIRPTLFKPCFLLLSLEETKAFQLCSCNWWSILLFGSFKDKRPHYLQTFYDQHNRELKHARF